MDDAQHIVDVGEIRTLLDQLAKELLREVVLMLLKSPLAVGEKIARFIHGYLLESI
jgi:hypothetical protein